MKSKDHTALAGEVTDESAEVGRVKGCFRVMSTRKVERRGIGDHQGWPPLSPDRSLIGLVDDHDAARVLPSPTITKCSLS